MFVILRMVLLAQPIILQVWATLALTFIHCIIFYRNLPYRYEFLNKFEGTALKTEILTFFLGLGIVGNDSSVGFQTICSVLVLISNFLFFVYILFVLRRHGDINVKCCNGKKIDATKAEATIDWVYNPFHQRDRNTEGPTMKTVELVVHKDRSSIIKKSNLQGRVASV